MAKENPKLELFQKENKIAEELQRISVFFEEAEENKRAIITPLLQNAAFMKITLEDLQEIINAEGVTDIYQNGANQHGVKQSATLQSYNSLIKNYAGVIKTLSQMLPPEKKQSVKSWKYKEKSQKELEDEQQKEIEHRKRIESDIQRAIEEQQRRNAEWEARKNIAASEY